MKSSEFIIEILKKMDPDTTTSQDELLAKFAQEYEEEIRFKILELWGEYVRELINPDQT